MFIWTRWVLQLTLSNNFVVNLGMLHRRLLCITWVFLSTWLHAPRMPMILLSPAQLCRAAAYQSLIGSIGWLATGTRPDLSLVHSFLLSYNSKPLTGHMWAALYALHYIHSTHDHGIHFTMSDMDPIHTFVHFPDSSDVEAYTDTKYPSPTHCCPLTSYSDACWDSQIGLAIQYGILLPLFKAQSMSGGIISVKVDLSLGHQERTSLSLCKAEIWATNKVSKLVMGICNLADSVCTSGHNINDTQVASPIYMTTNHASNGRITWRLSIFATHGHAQERGPWMGSRWFSQSCSCIWLPQSGWHLHKGDVRRSSFLTLTWFIHVCSIWLSSSVSGWNSSLAAAWWALALTDFAFGCFFVDIICQRFFTF